MMSMLYDMTKESLTERVLMKSTRTDSRVVCCQFVTCLRSYIPRTISGASAAPGSFLNSEGVWNVLLTSPIVELSIKRLLAGAHQVK